MNDDAVCAFQVLSEELDHAVVQPLLQLRSLQQDAKAANFGLGMVVRKRVVSGLRWALQQNLSTDSMALPQHRQHGSPYMSLIKAAADMRPSSRCLFRENLICPVISGRLMLLSLSTLVCVAAYFSSHSSAA